jgi:hypothetical protein
LEGQDGLPATRPSWSDLAASFSDYNARAGSVARHLFVILHFCPEGGENELHLDGHDDNFREDVILS